LVADEPTGNLDSKSANTIIDLFEELSSLGKTVVMVTHDPSLTSRTTRNLVIADGVIIGDSLSLKQSQSNVTNRRVSIE